MLVSMARSPRLVAPFVAVCAAATPLHSSAHQPEVQQFPSSATSSPCPARLVVRRVRIERVSDWARLDVTAWIHRDCSEATEQAQVPGGAPERAPDEVLLTPWPADAAILGLIEERSPRRLPAVSHAEGQQRFYAPQWGPKGSRGRVLLLDSVRGSQSRVRIRPLGRGEGVSFRYRALLPVQYDQGRWRLHLKGLSSEAAVEFASGLSPERQPGEGGPTYLWSEGGFGLQGELARIPWSDGSATLDWHLRVASAIRPVPEGSRLVVALDVSRSVSPEQLRRARELAGRWLAGHRSPRVAVLVFDRHVRNVTSGFGSVEEALRALAAPVVQGNGSFQELALAQGARLLRSVGGEGRLLLLSDGHVRRQLPAESMAKALQPRRPWLLYGEVPVAGERRHSSPELRELARAHGEHLRCDEGACDVAPLLAPSRLQGIIVDPPLYHAGISPWPLDSIAAGSRVAPITDTLPTKARSGRVRYRVWGAWEERAFLVDPRTTEAALAWRTAQEDSCRREPRWADLSRAVTPEWSYVQRWPGAIERHEPVGQEGGGGACLGICDDCALPGVTASSSASLENNPTRSGHGESWWRERWREGTAACGAPRARVQLWLDGPEIEEVELLPTGLGTRVDECLRDFAWDLNVPDGGGAPPGVPVVLELVE